MCSFLTRLLCGWGWTRLPPPFKPDLTGECCICLENLTSASVVSVDCQALHLYHAHCIQQWLQQKRSLRQAFECPLCQQRIGSHFVPQQ